MTPGASTLTRHVRVHEGFTSSFLRTVRRLSVCLPPGYARSRRRYPVLYFSDGQNLFDGATSFVAGEEWQLDEAAERLIRAGRIAPLIIVGIDHAGTQRMDELTPTRDPARKAGGRAHLYGRMIVEEIKPWIDARYRTDPSGLATGLGGSSLGGLAAMHLGLRYPDVFGRLAVMSPSVWWGERGLLRTAARARPGRRSRVWLDVGTAEGRRALGDARSLRDVLVSRGWQPGVDLAYVEARGADHSEAAWRARAPEMLQFLYPAAV